ncbi:MAG: hypothetical protein LBC35_00405 [Coriobacteriales bacterium]|jgi:hypothetical protein|nr:hypothetical protein [Coriobacteriales bacterium]
MKSRVEAKARKLTVAATLLLSMVLATALFAPAVFAADSDIASYDSSTGILTVNITSSTVPTYDQYTINTAIATAISPAPDLSGVTSLIINTDNVDEVAVGIVNNYTVNSQQVEFNAAGAITVNYTGNLDASNIGDVEAASTYLTSTPVNLDVSGTADLSSLTDTTGFGPTFHLSAPNIIAPEGVDLATWAAPLGLSTGQIITQGDKTYEVEADGSIVEIDEAEVPAKTGIR